MRFAVCKCGHNRAEHETHPDEHCYKCACVAFVGTKRDDAQIARVNLRIIPCSLRKANDFVAVYHRHSKRTARNGGKFAIGIASGNQVIGIAIVGNPLSATYMDGVTAEVLRTCVLPDPPKNCNSLLYGTCRRIWFEMGGRKILTYTLTHESGASLRGAGWTLAAEIKGHDTVTWGKSDHLTSRKQQDIIGERKYRWEAINTNFVACEPIWPIKVDALSMKPVDEYGSAMFEEERLIRAGVLEPNYGPNDNHRRE